MTLFLVLFGLLVVFTIFAFSTLKRKPIRPFPISWEKALEKRVLFYQKLSVKEKENFKSRMMRFLAEVSIEGVQTKITEEDKMLLAASAVIPVFGFGNWRYNNLSGILIYPDNFNQDLQFNAENEGRVISGLVGTGRFEKQMILSKTSLHRAFSNKTDKHNTPVHEFVHLLDKIDGNTDGIPERFLGQEHILPWINLMYEEMEAINNNDSDIRKYGGTKQAEFFAVASEYFFERPDLFERKHPELYEMLRLCFQQDPAVR
ncbi:MAG: Mlc titration factor MtfA (ptsG expression regulator) [Patiriisocius sp.]|jgi:Mlc titration factor MtfA (ptsG expression regulator)